MTVVERVTTLVAAPKFDLQLRAADEKPSVSAKPNVRHPLTANAFKPQWCHRVQEKRSPCPCLRKGLVLNRSPKCVAVAPEQQKCVGRPKKSGTFPRLHLHSTPSTDRHASVTTNDLSWRGKHQIFDTCNKHPNSNDKNPALPMFPHVALYRKSKIPIRKSHWNLELL
jgi:hypothetical protein